MKIAQAEAVLTNHNKDHLAPADDLAPPMLYKLNFAQVLRVLRFKKNTEK